MSEETTEERQNNELAALQAIYGDAVVDNRQTLAWKVWRPLDLLLTLHPLHNSDVQGVHCSVTLHFICCTAYPDKPPLISINKVHGLSNENVTKLLDELKALAEHQCGEVMIFQLATHAQQFLHDHNKPTLSFYDEMVKQKTEMEKLKLHDMQVENQKLKEEVQRRQEILRCAGRQRVQRSSISQENPDEGQGDAPELVYYADDRTSPAKKVNRTRSEVPCTCNTKGAQILRITQRNNKKVYIGNCLGHSSNGCTTYLAIDDESGERLIAKKWSLPPASDFQTRNRQLTSLHQDFKSVCRLKHSSLLPYGAMETCKEPSKRTVKQCIYVFRDFVLGSSLRFVRNRVKFSDRFEALKLIRQVGLGVFSALKDLHGLSVLHRDVRSENVFLDNTGAVKLVGVGLDSRLAEMFDGDGYCDRQTKSHDIVTAAQMLLSIVAQDNVYEIPSDLPGSAKDFFYRCLTEDEHSQWSADQLVNHGFLVDAPMKQPNGKLKDDAGSGSEDDDAVRKMPNPSPPMSGHSRLHAEFEVLTWLGRGAFGDVLKVKNKLDGGFYAIKRIQLNPESVQLNKKITREVKLLSRLNHENVVRYYNAWIESIIDTDSIDAARDEAVVSKSPEKKKNDSLQGIVAKLGQEVKVEWSMSEGPVQKNSSSDSEDDDDDEPDPWFNIMSPEEEDSSCIEFEEDSDNKSTTLPSEEIPDSPRPQSERLKQVLYIQMEFCEKHTLRQAIDNGLYQEHFRAWRLFREIVEGLAHVHQRGMIHRDLKPVNIFLDSSDHVKIGDFGLATKAFTTLLDEKAKPVEEIGGSLTGQVGTALYVAPELLQSASKVIYNQKVDIYSLGIIFFEMFHPPLSTGMERMMVLTDLRNKAIRMPQEFQKEENAKLIHVVRWLLNHDASLRPTCAELLTSEHIPRPVAEGALSGLLSHTLSERGSRGYQRLVGACLDQRQSPAEDLTYDSDVKPKQVDMLCCLKDIVIKVFRSHGAIEFSPPLLIPRARAWDESPNAVKVMTSSGTVCHLPHDLRLPFARYVAYSGTKYMRRYIVDRVFREKHVAGFHPREIIGCAFDIVTPKTDSLWPDAELLVVASRAATESNLKVTIQLNHTELLRTLLLSCGVPLDKHADIYPVLVDVSLGRITSLQLQTHLTSLCITNRDVSNLLRLMEADVSVYEVRELVAQLVKQAKWAKIVGQAIHELEAVYRNAKALGCDCPVTVAPFLAYNAREHRGVFWSMNVVRGSHKTVKYRAGDVIVAGGRYDALVEEFWKVGRAEKGHNAELKCSSVGFSMCLEKMAAMLKKMEIDLPAVKNVEGGLVCVCAWSDAGSGREGQAAVRRAQLARELWARGVRAALAVVQGNAPTAIADAHEQTRASVVLLQDDACVRAACWEGDRVQEHKVPYIDVIRFVEPKLNQGLMQTPIWTDASTNRSTSWNETEKWNGPITSVTFITASERMTKNSKRHCENQISTQITSSLVALGLQPVLSRVRVCVIALACEAACVRLLAAQLAAPLDAHELPTAFRPVFDAFTKRHNVLEDALGELTNIVKQSNQNRSDETQLYALYSIPDSICRLIT